MTTREDRVERSAAKSDAWARENYPTLAAQSLREIYSDLHSLASEDAAERGIAAPVELGELLALKMPPRQWLIKDLMQERDLGMEHGWRGIGKTRVAHGLAVAVASGGRFLRWHAPEPRGVLLVDGELPREELQVMLAQAVAAADAEPVAPLRILSADVADATLYSLARPEGREQVERHLDGISLVIFDAITTLCPGAGPENEAESWEVMQSWLLELRRRGVAVLLLHHDNKSGSQRGTSRREDVLSTVVQLRRPADYRPSEGARFHVHLTKSRGIIGDAAEPFEAKLSTDHHGQPVWTWRPLEDAQAVAVQRLRDDGLTYREIASELNIGLATVNRALKRSAVPAVPPHSPEQAEQEK